jgi:ADP-heptose:LPS heptosyltransferase
MRDLKKILIFRTEHIGDYALSLPFLKTVRENYPLAKIDIVVGPWNREFAEATPYVDNIIIWENPLVKRHIRIIDFLNLKNILKIVSFFIKIRKENYNLALAFSNRKFIKVLIKFFRADKKIVGFDYLKDENENERFDRMIFSLGLKKSKSLIRLKLLKKAEKEVEIICKKADKTKIVIHPITPLEEKNWLLKNWAELINKVHKKNKKVTFFIIGVEKDKIAIEQLISKTKYKDKVINLAGKLNIAQTIDLISKSNLIVGGDSGPVHFAELTNTPILALFGPTNEKRWGPYRKIDKVIKKGKINGIGVLEVFKWINQKI